MTEAQALYLTGESPTLTAAQLVTYFGEHKASRIADKKAATSFTQTARDFWETVGGRMRGMVLPPARLTDVTVARLDALALAMGEA